MGKSLTLHIKLTIAGQEIEGAVPVPAGKVPARAVLPVLQQLTDTVVSVAEQSERAAGRSVSCRTGCGACCRQMVPISPAEAHALAALVEAMPAGHRRIIQSRFAKAKAAISRAGVAEKLQNRHHLSSAEQAALDRDYFAARVACPFLEDESCSIHAVRPMACREYLVTSPAEHCARPTAERIVQVEMPAKISSALTRACGNGSNAYPWIPLVLALDVAATSREDGNHSAPGLVQKILSDL